MKEQEKEEIKRLSDRLDAMNHKKPNVIQQGVLSNWRSTMRKKRRWKRKFTV